MAESIFPFMDPRELIEETEEIPVAREWAWDFNLGDFKTRNGKMYQVEKKDALKIWLWKLFKTHRFREIVYNWEYGHELEELIGKGYTAGYLNSEAERYVKETIEYNLGDYITRIENFEIDFKKSVLTIKFRAVTIYGDLEVITDV